MADTVGSTPLTAAASCYVFACVLVPYVYAVTPMVIVLLCRSAGGGWRHNVRPKHQLGVRSNDGT